MLKSTLDLTWKYLDFSSSRSLEFRIFFSYNTERAQVELESGQVELESNFKLELEFSLKIPFFTESPTQVRGRAQVRC